jgi:cell division protein FtsA
MGRRGHHVVVGLDIGTTKICAIIGDIKSDGVVDVLGVGTHPSRGLKKGVVSVPWPQEGCGGQYR